MAKKFRDGAGREWTPRLNLDVMRRFSEKTGHDFSDNETLQLVLKLNTRACSDLMWFACEAQAEELGVDFRTLCASITNQAMFEEMVVALIDALTDFFPYLRPVREEALKQLQERAANRAQ